MKDKNIICCLVGLILLLSCNSNKNTSQNNNPKSVQKNTDIKRYAVGKGGGFTGAYEEYILCEDGTVFKYDFSSDREVLTKKLSQADLIYFLEKIEELGLEGISINEPGNMNYYIEVREGNISTNKLIWGSNQYYPPNNIVDFYKELFKKLSERE